MSAGWLLDKKGVYTSYTLTNLPGLLNEKRSEATQTLAYVCSGMHCLAPVASVDALVELIMA